MSDLRHIPPIPEDEPFRLEDLKALCVLDTSSDPNFERVVRLASQIFDVPIALISLVDSDRQWFKAKFGIDDSETPREIAFCAHAILQDLPLVIEDASKDARFADNPLVVGRPNIRFYAGAPLITGSGRRIGTLCVIDRKPRSLTQKQITILRTLAAVVVQALYAHKQTLEAKLLLDGATAKANLDAQFYSTLSQELREPLHHVLGFAQLLKVEDYETLGKSKFEEFVGAIATGAEQLFALFDRFDQLERSVQGLDPDPTVVDILAMIAQIVRAFGTLAAKRRQRIVFRHDETSVIALISQQGLRLILDNLIYNSIEHGRDEGTIDIVVSTSLSRKMVRIDIRDDGPGIPEAVVNGLDLASALEPPGDRQNGKRPGLGLKIANRLASAMGCELRLEPQDGGGTIATVLFPTEPSDGLEVGSRDSGMRSVDAATQGAHRFN